MRLLPAAAAVAVVALASSPAAAQSIDVPSGTYALDKTHASIVWKVSHIGYSTYTGMFQRGAIDATITLDAEDVAKSSVTATIEGTGVETLHPVDFDPRGTDFNAEVAGDKFLNANSFPAITFKSTGIEVTGDNTANISGELTLNNATHPVVLETTLNRASDHPMTGSPVIGISATSLINRTEFGVDNLAGPIGAEVRVEIEGEFHHKE